MTTPKYDLSTAIRIGAKLRGQTHAGHNYYLGKTCVLGAALQAETGDTNGPACSLWPELTAHLDEGYDIADAIIALNDHARWTREEIADWLDMVLP